MPQGNSQALKTKRAEIFDLVKSFTIRLEYLFKIRQQFEQNGELPLEDDVWPMPKVMPKTTLSDDPEELRKMKKNQQTANTKDQNMLDYQTMVKGDEKKTMPSGPKRNRIENRIKGRLRFIQEIDLKSLTKAIGKLQNGLTTHFYSWGNFNLVRLMMYILKQTGPVHTFITSYSFS